MTRKWALNDRKKRHDIIMEWNEIPVSRTGMTGEGHWDDTIER
ncbi:hypothetical protein [Wolbachia endosymbiont of Atemnus politus]|nr:hypothetical protein [Wolbachia endosymbiont of Atemnus politus]